MIVTLNILVIQWKIFFRQSFFWYTVGRVLNVRFFWLQIVSFYTKHNKKIARNTQWIILHMTTPLYASVHARSRKHACVRSTCMHVHVCTAVDRQEWVFFNSLSQLSTCQHHATVTWVVWHSINSPPHISLVPRPHPRGGKRVWWHLSAFSVLVSSAFLLLWKPIRLQLYDFHVTLHLVAQQRLYNASWRFSASQWERSSMILHCIA